MPTFNDDSSQQPPPRHRKWRSWLGWSLVAALTGCAILFVYCTFLFQELQVLMENTPSSKPSVLYSDLFVLKKGDAYPYTFLKERLSELKIAFEEKEGVITWKTRYFEYPETLLPRESPLRVPADSTVQVKIISGVVDDIRVGETLTDQVAIEPVVFAQIAGSNKSIRNYTPLPEIPTYLLQAIIAIEDQRFLEHPGFDLRSLARAIWVNIKTHAISQGGSTLTQQLIKNLLASPQKTVFRKIRELILAILVEAKYSKDVILEKYLNEVYFGQVGFLEVHGVAEAARYFFNKPVARLSLAESALIAGVIRGPGFYSPYKYLQKATERKNTVLHKMQELKIISEPEMLAAEKEKLQFAPPSQVNNKAPYFADYVKAQVLDQLKERVSIEDLSAEGLKIYTTVDLIYQKFADQAVASTVKELEARYKIQPPLRLEGLLVAAENKTGYVRALVGGRSYAETTFNRVLNMKRQVGSTFKPIAYLAAFEKGTDSKGEAFTPDYKVVDEPWTYDWNGESAKDPKKKPWSPKNYEKEYRGEITLREAFINSINIPMAKIGVDIGIDRILPVAKKMGINEKLMAVPSLVLGAVDLNPMEVLQVYSTFANLGERIELTTVKAVLDSEGNQLARFAPKNERVFEESLIQQIVTLLHDVTVEGTAKIMPTLGYTKTAYGKTGTTSFYRDAWFAGFSEGLAVVTWTGFDELKLSADAAALMDEEAIEKAKQEFKSPAQLTGAGSALPTWVRFFRQARP